MQKNANSEALKLAIDSAKSGLKTKLLQKFITSAGAAGTIGLLSGTDKELIPDAVVRGMSTGAGNVLGTAAGKGVATYLNTANAIKSPKLKAAITAAAPLLGTIGGSVAGWRVGTAVNNTGNPKGLGARSTPNGNNFDALFL